MALDGSGPGGRRLSARLCAVGVAVAALATGGGLLAGSVPAGTTTPGVGGRVYVDVDTNGERGPDEPGLAGVTVAAFADDNEFVASTVTDVQGSWALAVDRAVRIEVDPRSGEGERWAVESVAWGMPAVGVAVPGDLDHDVALMDPARVCGDDPKVVMSCFFASAASTDAPAVRTFDESDGVPEVGDQRVTGRDERWIDATSAAEHQEVGSVYGAATDSDSGSVVRLGLRQTVHPDRSAGNQRHLPDRRRRGGRPVLLQPHPRATSENDRPLEHLGRPVGSLADRMDRLGRHRRHRRPPLRSEPG